VALDWYPTVKKLGLLRRQWGDLERKIKDYGVMGAKFDFPDNAERSILSNAKAELVRALPLVDNDAAWTAISLVDVQRRAKEDRISRAYFIFNWFSMGTDLGTAGAERHDSLADWFWNRQYATGVATGDFFRGSFPWHNVLSELEPRTGRRLADRYVIVALAAPLPDLLDFINHVSWGEARLEIVHLHLEPGIPLAMAWLVCRGSYLVPTPSPWLVKMEQGEGGAEQLIDPDSPLLWQKANPLFAPAVEKRELPPASGGDIE
jgi:hypothetical protein